jgi:phosphopantetheinyl transferase
VAAVAYYAGEPRKAGGTIFLPRTGCDVQQVNIRRNRDEIIRRFYHEEEQRYVEAARNIPEGNLRFFKLWVLKEAYLKMKGFSIGDIAKTPVFFPDRELSCSPAAGPEAVEFYLSEWSEPPDAYMLAVCLEGSGETLGPPETVWFSREHLPGGPWLPAAYTIPQ